MSKKRRQYTEEFKESVVKLVTEQGGGSLSEDSRNLGVNFSALRRWKKALETGNDKPPFVTEPENLHAELARLKKENHRLGLERDILKKATPISLPCEVLGVSRSGYYAWRKQVESARQKEYERGLVKQQRKRSLGTIKPKGRKRISQT